MTADIILGAHRIGSRCPVFIVGEIGSNHCRDKNVVKKLVDVAAGAGFDAVKFQTYDPEDVFSQHVRTPDVQLEAMYGDRSWWDVAKEYVLMPRDWFGEMFDYARAKKLEVFSTVHSVQDAEFVSRFDPPAFKVASIDVSHTDFLEGLAAFSKPVLMSTGLHHEQEIDDAVDTLKKAGNHQILLLHCVSNYPPAQENLNLKNISMLHTRYELPVGYSDHSADNRSISAAVALGACLVEKHITLDRACIGPDHHFALDPAGMEDLVACVRSTEKMLGAYERTLSGEEMEARTLVRRSVVARNNIKKGTVFSRKNLKLSRPGTGIHPKHLNGIIGRKAKTDIRKEDLIAWESVE